MLNANRNLMPSVETKPFMEAFFYVKDEQTLDEFWSFMMKEEGLTKTIEFIVHIASEVLYESKEEIGIEFKFYKYLSYFRVSNQLFSKKAMQHYLKIRAFVSMEIDDESVILKSLRDNDAVDCRFCKVMSDDDPKIVHRSYKATEKICQECIDFFEIDAEPFEGSEGMLGVQKTAVDLQEELGDDELRYLNDELKELEVEIFETLNRLNEKEDMSLLHPISLKIFIYSQKLLASVEFYELSITLRTLSFTLQKLFSMEYNAAKKALTLCECMLSDVSGWRKSTITGDKTINAHYLDASLATSMSQIEKIVGGLA